VSRIPALFLTGRRRQFPIHWTSVPGRPAWHEISLLVSVYLLYTQTRLLALGNRETALANGQALLDAERSIGLAPEKWLNEFVSAHHLLAVPADYAYASCHYVVTMVVVVWLWRRHPEAYLAARRTLIAATLIALIGYWLVPMAPPRMLPGFVDTMGRYGQYGWWSDAGSVPQGLATLTNQLAAMPSLHVGWAIWCGYQIGRQARRRWLRALGLVYPLLTVLVVISTGNHYLADALAGLLVLLAGWALVRGLARIERKTLSADGVAAGVSVTWASLRRDDD
jgi:hypothetical protein